jgi:hypothetical protein
MSDEKSKGHLDDMKHLAMSLNVIMASLDAKGADAGDVLTSERLTRIYSKGQLALGMFLLLRVITDDEAIESFRNEVRGQLVIYELEQAVEKN